MSYEIYVYSERDTVVNREELTEQLHALGWGVAFVIDDKTLNTAVHGPVGDEKYLVFWPLRSPHRRKIDWTLSTANRQEFETLYHADVIGNLALWLTSDSDIDDEQIAIINRKYRDVLRRTRTHYTVRTSAGRNGMGFAAQFACWYAVGALTGGVLEDPQEGTMQFASEVSARKMRPEALVAKVTSPSLSSIWFFISKGLVKQLYLAIWYFLLACLGVVIGGCVTTVYPLLRCGIVILALAHGFVAFKLFIKPKWALDAACVVMIVSICYFVAFLTINLRNVHSLLPIALYTIVSNNLIQRSVTSEKTKG